jgi:tellurite resistance protein TerC
LHWIYFIIIVAILLLLDLGVMNRKNCVMTFPASLRLSLFYITIACLFGVFIFLDMGEEKAREYFTCYFIEKTMSLDNIFIISVIFQFFSIPLMYQHRVLFLGIIGVIVFRAILIYLGSIVIAQFSWLLYLFAIILIITGVKTLYISDRKYNIKKSYIYRFLQKHCNITNTISGDNFFIKTNNRIIFTPLFVSLIMVEITDVIFALDSIPAIFAITNDSYIIYTSNIFAILGLRALFFCLASVVERFSYIKYSLALILIFIGIKIFAEHFIAIPSYIPLIVTITLLSFGVIASFIKKKSSV